MKAASKPSIAPIRQSKEAGFTLVELLITIIIVGILASLAIPSFREFIAGQRIKTATFDIIAMYTLARSEAIKRNVTVNVFKGASGFTVLPTGSSVVLKLENPRGITLTGGNNVEYNTSGRLNAAFTPLQISSTSSSQVRCISIDLSGRPNTKNTAC